MTGITKKINQDILTAAEKELKKIAGRKTVTKLLAIIITGRCPVKQVAEMFEVSPRTIFRWVDTFASEGLEGLKDNPKGHPRGKISDKHARKIENWILNGKNSDGKKVRWTLEKLKIELEKDYDIDISTTALWNHLKKNKLSLKK